MQKLNLTAQTPNYLRRLASSLVPCTRLSTQITPHPQVAWRIVRYVAPETKAMAKTARHEMDKAQTAVRPWSQPQAHLRTTPVAAPYSLLDTKPEPVPSSVQNAGPKAVTQAVPEAVTEATTVTMPVPLPATFPAMVPATKLNPGLESKSAPAPKPGFGLESQPQAVAQAEAEVEAKDRAGCDAGGHTANTHLRLSTYIALLEPKIIETYPTLVPQALSQERESYAIVTCSLLFTLVLNHFMSLL